MLALEAALVLSFVHEETARLYSRRVWPTAHRPGSGGKSLESGRLAVTDSTHVKANASTASEQEMGTQSDVPPTMRSRGNGGLLPFCCSFIPQKNNTMHVLTLRGVFFPA